MALERLVWVVLLVGTLNSCNQQQSQPATQVEVPTKPPLPSIEELKDKNFEEAKRRLGSPSIANEYYFKDANLGEFRVGLLNFFSFNDSTDRYKRIKEATWDYGLEKGQAKLLTIWYVQEGQRWKYLDIVEYLQTDDF